MDNGTKRALLLDKEVANMTLDAIGEAVLRTDIHGHITYLNHMAEVLTGWSRQEARGLLVTDVLRLLPSGASVDKTVESNSQNGKDPKGVASYINVTLVRRDGFKFEVESKRMPIQDGARSLTGWLVAFHDVSEARAKSLAMSHSAQHDALTDLPNRVLFHDRVAQAIVLAQRQDSQFAVMFVDIDLLKKINDSLGHDVGDKLLQSVAQRLVACVRRSDTICRIGGDEFVVLLSRVEHAEDAAFSARKILRALARPHGIGNKSLDISVSIGVSAYPGDGETAEDLMNRADNAMYEAKKGGRNNFRFFRSEMHAELAERQSLEADLRYALGRNEFVLHYQPRVDLHTGQITGMEALIRWIHPQRGIIYPAHFVSIAEECGLILPIGQWVRLEACRQARAWQDSGLGIVPVSVNVSAAEFTAKDFLSGVRAALIATGVQPENLELELTETVLMHDAEAAVVTLAKLKVMGVQLFIDDFGTGYSSFTYLRRFPSDALKLHQSFVHDITSDPRDAAIVSAMINVGASLKQRVIAEGVETQAQLDFLRNHGCAEGQGYYFSRPVVAEQAAKILQVGIAEQP